MSYLVKDPYLQFLNINVFDVQDDNVIISTAIKKEFYNFGKMPHGGFLGAFAVASAEVAAEIILKKEMRLSSLSSEFADVCKTPTIFAKSKLVYSDGNTAAFSTFLFDESGALITTHTVTLVDKDTKDVNKPFKRTLFNAKEGRGVLYGNPLPYNFAYLGFEYYHHVYLTELYSDSEVNEMDLYDDFKDRHGNFHDGCLYAMTDSAVSGYLSSNNISSRTMMSSMNVFRQVSEGPLKCYGSIVRRGNNAILCETTIVSNNEVVSTGQFVLNSKPVPEWAPEYVAKAIERTKNLGDFPEFK